MATKRRSAAECVATRYGQDIAEVKYAEYCPRMYSAAVFTLFDGYVCCPPVGKTPPSEWSWVQDGSVFDRPVYFATKAA